MDIETAQMQIPEQDDDEEANLKVYLPGEKLEEGEVLVPDNSAYELLHTMNVEWPCLSFDVLRDNMGPSRSSVSFCHICLVKILILTFSLSSPHHYLTQFPATTYVVAGSQAVKPIDNKIYIMKMSQLHKTKFDDDGKETMDIPSKRNALYSISEVLFMSASYHFL